MVKFILDADLTLMDSSEYFSNSNIAIADVLNRQMTAEYQLGLLNLPSYPWVQRWKYAMQEASEVVVITGRGEHLIEVTKKWIEYNIGLTFFKVISVPFTTYEKYCEQKIDMTIKELDRMNKEQKEAIHVIDDNDKVVQASLYYKNNTKSENIIVHQVFKGTIVQMILKSGYIQARLE